MAFNRWVETALKLGRDKSSFQNVNLIYKII